jgi:hypothetical protein
VFLFQGSALRFARRLGGEEPPAVVVLDQFPIELDADIGGTSSISVARKIGSLLKTLSNRRKRNPASLASPRPDRFQSKPCPVVTLAH